jgi:MFS family permease
MALDKENRRARTMAIALLMATALGLLLTFVFADLARSPLGTQLQFWRTLWIAVLGSALALGLMVVNVLVDRTDYNMQRLLVAAIAFSVPWFTSGIVFAVSIGVIAIIFVIMYFDAQSSDRTARPYVTPALLGVLGLIVVVEASFYLAHFGFAFVTAGFTNDLTIDAPALSMIFGLLLVAAVQVGGRGGSRSWIAAIMLGVAVILGLGTWDSRSDWTRFVEGPNQPVLVASPDDVVLVEDPSWGYFTLFKRPSFFNVGSGAGIVFSSEQARDYEERRQGAASIGILGSQFAFRSSVDAGTVTAPTPEAVRRLCADPRGPDVLLLHREAIGLDSVIWLPDDLAGATSDRYDGDIVRPDRFFRYDCVDVLSE